MAKIQLLGSGGTITAKSILVEVICDCGVSHVVEVAMGSQKMGFTLMRKGTSLKNMKPLDRVTKDLPYRPQPVA